MISREQKPQFFVDENVAGLARWLRLLGFDTVTAKGWNDNLVSEHVSQGQRILITRDRELASDMEEGSVILVESDSLVEQLRTVLNVVGLSESEDWFQRCSVCNTELRLLTLEEIRQHDGIPSWIRRQVRPDAWACDTCCRVYWKGSHFERSFRFLRALQTL